MLRGILRAPLGDHQMRAEPFDKLRTAPAEACLYALRQAQAHFAASGLVALHERGSHPPPHPAWSREASGPPLAQQPRTAP
jgi:hypothetical protein